MISRYGWRQRFEMKRNRRLRTQGCVFWGESDPFGRALHLSRSRCLTPAPWRRLFVFRLAFVSTSKGPRALSGDVQSTERELSVRAQAPRRDSFSSSCSDKIEEEKKEEKIQTSKPTTDSTRSLHPCLLTLPLFLLLSLFAPSQNHSKPATGSRAPTSTPSTSTTASTAARSAASSSRALVRR